MGPVAPRRRRSRGRRRLVAVICGVCLGLLGGVVLGYRASLPPATHFPHAGHDDFTAFGTPRTFPDPESLDPLAAGYPLCPCDEVLKADATTHPGDRAARGALDGRLSYSIERLTVLRGGRELETDFLLVASASDVPLRVEHHDTGAKGLRNRCLYDDVLACIPVLAAQELGIIWIGNAPLTSITVTPLDPDELPIDSARHYLSAQAEAPGDGSLTLSLTYDTTSLGCRYHGPLALVLDHQLIDLTDIQEDELDESPAQALATRTVIASLTPAQESLLLETGAAYLYAAGQLEATFDLDPIG